MLDELSRTQPRMQLQHPTPEIVEFLNLADYTTQTTTAVSTSLGVLLHAARAAFSLSPLSGAHCWHAAQWIVCPHPRPPGVDEPLFQPYPMGMVFRDYEPFSTYEQTLYFRNNDNVARRIRIERPDSQYFEISAPRPNGKSGTLKNGKVAAGMSTKRY